MNAKKIVSVVLLLFVAVSVGFFLAGEMRAKNAEQGEADAVASTAGADVMNTADEGGSSTSADAGDADAERTQGEVTKPHKVVAYYFHNTQRCMTCNKIERMALETIQSQFAEALKSGDLEWRVLNMEEPPNVQFIEDYELVTASLVIVDMRDGKQHDWTKLEKVWEYVHDDEATFRKYVADQVRAYLES